MTPPSIAVARLATAEARWFCRGALPDEVARWHAADGAVEQEPARRDRYLRLPGVHGVGVKSRCGQLEIKARVADTGLRVAWTRTTSPVEAWLKWSAPAGEIVDAWWQADGVAPIVVAKLRRRRRWSGAAGAATLELAALEVGGRAFWSFAIEADAPAAVPAALAAAGDAPGRWALVAKGYPAWLDDLE